MWKRIAAAVLMTACLANGTQAATVIVDSRSTGLFGESVVGATPLTDAGLIGAGTQVTISATGGILLGGGLGADPDGSPLITPTFGLTANSFAPLQEAAVDAGTPVDTGGLPAGSAPNYGALMGALVAPSVTSFQNTDFGGEVLSSDLFLIGSALVFNVTQDSRLLLGINDTFAANNFGAFEVTFSQGPIVEAVPLPAAMPLLATALIGFGFLGWRRRARMAQQ